MSDTHERRSTWIDKTKWAPGPWQDEPDKVQWVDENTELDCMAVRHGEYGHWCGYVGVPEGHPAFGQDYNHVLADVHGGLTYSGLCQEGEDAEAHGICHVPFPGRPAVVWWVGFDACHLWDLQPAKDSLFRSLGIPMHSSRLNPREEYRPLVYIQAECASLASQIQED